MVGSGVAVNALRCGALRCVAVRCGALRCVASGVWRHGGGPEGRVAVVEEEEEEEEEELVTEAGRALCVA